MDTRHGPDARLVSKAPELLTQTTRTQLHEQSHRGRASRSAIRPEHDRVFNGVAPALEEVEEQVPCLDVDVSCESPEPKSRTRPPLAI